MQTQPDASRAANSILRNSRQRSKQPHGESTERLGAIRENSLEKRSSNQQCLIVDQTPYSGHEEPVSAHPMR